MVMCQVWSCLSKKFFSFDPSLVEIGTTLTYFYKQEIKRRRFYFERQKAKINLFKRIKTHLTLKSNINKIILDVNLKNMLTEEESNSQPDMTRATSSNVAFRGIP